MKSGIQSLYALKAVCALLVLCIHLLFSGRQLLIPFLYVAVPCFYLIGGYFLVDDNDFISLSRLRKKVVSLVLLTLKVNLVYCILRLIIYPDSVDFGLISLLRWLIVGKMFSGHLWFLHAYIEALLIILLYIRIRGQLKLNKATIALASVLLIPSLLLGRYSFLLGDNFRFSCYCNVLTVALPFILLGVLIRKHEAKLVSILDARISWVIMGGITILAYFEFGIQLLFPAMRSDGYLSLFGIPLSIIVFYLCIVYKDIKLNDWLYRVGKDYSADIYFYHIFLIMVIRLFWPIPSSFLSPLLFFFLSIVLSYCLKKIRRRFSLWRVSSFLL